MVSPMATPMANEAADRAPAVVTRTGRRRQLTEENKRRTVEETCRPGQSLSVVARRDGIDPPPIVPVAASPRDWRIGCADKLRGRSKRRITAEERSKAIVLMTETVAAHLSSLRGLPPGGSLSFSQSRCAVCDDSSPAGSRSRYLWPAKRRQIASADDARSRPRLFRLRCSGGRAGHEVPIELAARFDAGAPIRSCSSAMPSYTSNRG
jgi:hypothetical protein